MRRTPREVFFKLKQNFDLSKEQQAVLIGTVLGDGNLRFRGNECRLHIKHSFNQMKLCEYKRRVFAPITSMPVRVFKQKVANHDYWFSEFATLTHPVFTKYYKMFYPTGKKIIPTGIAEILVDPISLAVWIMDDGAAEYAGLSIQTHCFTSNEVDRLVGVIKDNFGIECLSRSNRGKRVIYFPKTSINRLKNLLDNYVIDEMKYKFVPYDQRKPRRDCTPESHLGGTMIQSDPTGNSRSLVEITKPFDILSKSNNNVETPVVLAVNDEH